MAPQVPANVRLLPYYTRLSRGRAALFWAGYVFETLTFRRLSTIVRLRLWGE